MHKETTQWFGLGPKLLFSSRSPAVFSPSDHRLSLGNIYNLVILNNPTRTFPKSIVLQDDVLFFSQGRSQGHKEVWIFLVKQRYEKWLEWNDGHRGNEKRISHVFECMGVSKHTVSFRVHFITSLSRASVVFSPLYPQKMDSSSWPLTKWH